MSSRPHDCFNHSTPQISFSLRATYSTFTEKFCHQYFQEDFMQQLTELIKKRASCRTYADKPTGEKALQEFSRIVAKEYRGPFGNRPEFQLISMDMSSPTERKKLGTYGVIKNARFFLAGKIKKAEKAVEDYGYCMESLILQATALGLGTCWLAGTFNATGFAQKVELQPDELLPAISPVGYPANHKSLTEKIFRRFAGANYRKPWSDIFFKGNFSEPLTWEQAGVYAAAIENVRRAPSASNRQPWRILLDNAGNIFHFYLERSFGYKLREIAIQDIDMGIAMNHFELTAREAGYAGGWSNDKNAPQKKRWDYIVSWQDKS